MLKLQQGRKSAFTLGAAATNITILAQSSRTPGTTPTKFFHLYGRWGEVGSGVGNVLTPLGSPLLRFGHSTSTPASN